ncbi:MAG: hypothetical protein R3E31_02080 [Chloroflexota bacterium]
MSCCWRHSWICPSDPGDKPETACPTCGGTSFTPESDVMDTWFTSSLSPQITGTMVAPGGRANNTIIFARCVGTKIICLGADCDPHIIFLENIISWEAKTPESSMIEQKPGAGQCRRWK